MPDLTPLTILVDKSIADDAARKNMVEVVLRNGKAKYKAMIKCALSNASDSSGKNEIFNTVLNSESANNYAIEQVNHAVRNVGKGIKKVDGHIVSLSNQVKDMSVNVDSIFKSVNMIKAMAVLNVGLSMANMAVNVIGFVVISNHLNEIDRQLVTIAGKLDDVKNLKKNELIQEFHQVTMYYNSLSDDISNGKNDLRRQEEFLIETNSFFGKLKGNIMDKSLEISDLLKMIYSLIVPYTAILNSFVTAYYLENQKLPSNYESFTEIYDSLLDDSYLDTVERYWFIDRDQNNHDTYLAIDAMMLLTIQCKAEILDRMEILKVFNTKDKLDSLNEAMNEEMTQQAEKDAMKVADALHKDPAECKQVLLSALS